MASLTYPVTDEPLSPEDGGAYLARAPDLPGCVSDGETPAEALAQIEAAIADWLSAAKALGRTPPQPSRPGVIAAA